MTMPFMIESTEYVTDGVRADPETIVSFTCNRSEMDGSDPVAFALDRFIGQGKWEEVERSTFERHGSHEFKVPHKIPEDRKGDLNYRCPLYRVRAIQKGQKQPRWRISYYGGALVAC